VSAIPVLPSIPAQPILLLSDPCSTVKPSSITYLTDRASLQAFSRDLRGTKRLALDTEFVGEESFLPRLELVQVATADSAAVIDVPGVGSLDDLAEVLSDPQTEKVVHAGRQDLELLYLHTGQVPAPIFDTQLAAAMVGYGSQAAYAHLVQRILGVTVEKGHTLTNWSQRPLRHAQLAYALEDVEYLLSVYEHLHKRLVKFGRLDWAQEEFRRLGSKLTSAARSPGQRYQRIRGWENLKPRAVAVLRELAAWREKEAMQRNVPRGRVVRDDVLLELARQSPMTLPALTSMRGLHAPVIERSGGAIVGAIQRGLAVPESEWPEVPTRRPEPEAAGQLDLLQAVLKARAVQEHIAPSLLATVEDLKVLVGAKRRDQLELPILQGWRRKLAGNLLLDVLDGKLEVGINPQTGKVRIGPEPPQPNNP
jgi:ribonuclease D